MHGARLNVALRTESETTSKSCARAASSVEDYAQEPNHKEALIGAQCMVQGRLCSYGMAFLPVTFFRPGIESHGLHSKNKALTKDVR